MYEIKNKCVKPFGKREIDDVIRWKLFDSQIN